MSRDSIHFEIIASSLDQYQLPVAEYLRQTPISQVPCSYIEYIDVEYKNGALIQLNGTDLSDPIIIRNDGSAPSTGKIFKNISNIKIYMNFEQLQAEVDDIIDIIFQDLIVRDN